MFCWSVSSFYDCVVTGTICSDVYDVAKLCQSSSECKIQSDSEIFRYDSAHIVQQSDSVYSFGGSQSIVDRIQMSAFLHKRVARYNAAMRGHYRCWA